jgi:cation diffusion facilitator CzcD-associated flavoprotein CzcO
MMVSGVPNLVCTFGYINASWTLRADLTCEYVCRLLDHLDRTRTTQVTPVLRDADRSMPARPWVDDFSAGYMRREMHRFPRQGDRAPWINPQDYKRDKRMIRHEAIADGVLVFSRASDVAAARQPLLQAAE